ncbi:MAG: hypothetical protein ACTHU0_17420 [Kofleriaceae bacterium]
MIRLAGIALLVVAACSGGNGERVAECDQLIATARKISQCDKLEPKNREQLRQTLKLLDEATNRLEAAGVDQAPRELVEATRKTCSQQHEQLRTSYQQLAPDCLR